MIKYCHELTKEEMDALIKSGITYSEFGEKYPQPEWCNYHNATYGDIGCWSLIDFSSGHSRVTDEEYCKTCDCYNAYFWVDGVQAGEAMRRTRMHTETSKGVK